MKANPIFKWSIEGHADTISIECNDNYEISLWRAKNIFNYLVSKGVNQNKLEVYGFSHFIPIADNTSSEGRKQNRRVEIIKLRP